MKNLLKSISACLTVLALTLSLTVTVRAAEAVISFRGVEEGFGFGSGSQYTGTDLFDNFKGVMPGDRLREDITIRNDAGDCDYIQLSMKAVPHDDQSNPPSPSAAGGETALTMADFLSRLTMRIYNGSTLIYEASPEEAGALADFVPLGALLPGQSLTLGVELDIPLDMGNEYANRVGEVDWVFLAEARSFSSLTVRKVWEDDNDPNRPDRVAVQLLEDGTPYGEPVILSASCGWVYTWNTLDGSGPWSVRETDIPRGYTPSYQVSGDTVTITNTAALIQTGQQNWPIPVLCGVGLTALAVGAVLLRKKKHGGA